MYSEHLRPPLTKMSLQRSGVVDTGIILTRFSPGIGGKHARASHRGFPNLVRFGDTMPRQCCRYN
jgi:hypothetical protein